jgi:hypothetical protein
VPAAAGTRLNAISPAGIIQSERRGTLIALTFIALTFSAP